MYVCYSLKEFLYLRFVETLVVPLVVLVLTAKGNVSQIADALLKQGLPLERPGSMWTPYFKANDKLIYHNPHEGAADTSALAGPSRWVQPPVATKNVEIQRSAADAVFENLRGEEDLPETSPGKNALNSSERQVLTCSQVSVYRLSCIPIRGRPCLSSLNESKNYCSAPPARCHHCGSVTAADGRTWSHRKLST